MTSSLVRGGHGTGAAKPHVELVADEISNGVQAPPTGGPSDEQHADGTMKKGAKRIPSMGGKARAAKARTEAKIAKYARRLLGPAVGLIGVQPTFKPRLQEAEDWCRAKCQELARDVGGGRCGAGVCALVKSAAWQQAFSNYLFDLAASGSFHWETPAEERAPNTRPTVNLPLIAQASRLATDSRQNLLAAHELCAREAMARPQVGGTFGDLFHRKDPT